MIQLLRLCVALLIRFQLNDYRVHCIAIGYSYASSFHHSKMRMALGRQYVFRDERRIVILQKYIIENDYVATASAEQENINKTLAMTCN
jgi:hypothetical protein